MSCNEAGELYTGSSVAADYRYSYETWRLDAYGPDFLETMRQLTDHAALAGDPQYDAIYAQYTALPDSLPQNVYDMAVVMAGGAHNPYEQMVNMEHYLRTNYRYTLTPGNVPRGRDFVDYFLETGEGYCVYFASCDGGDGTHAGHPGKVCHRVCPPAGRRRMGGTGIHRACVGGVLFPRRRLADL